MAEKLGTIKILLWIGVILGFGFFLYLTFFYATDEVRTVEIFYLRIIAIYFLSWAVLLFFAQKDVVKNIAIINCAIISFVLMILADIVYPLTMGGRLSLEHWIQIAFLFVYTVLLFIFKPKATQ